jgi:hypothetical protein
MSIFSDMKNFNATVGDVTTDSMVAAIGDMSLKIWDMTCLSEFYVEPH